MGIPLLVSERLPSLCLMLAPDWPAGADVGVGDGDHTPLLADAGLEAGHTRHPRVLAKFR